MKPTIVLIDDHCMIRKGFAACVTETRGFTVAGEAASLAGAYELFEALPAAPDVVLLDIGLGEDSGLEFLAYLKEKYPEGGRPAVLVYSIFEDAFRVQSALRMGAMGYLSKSAGESEIGLALDALLEGKTYVESRLFRKIDATPDFFSLLTRREREILALVQKNHNNSRIAQELGVEVRTIENYMSRIYDKTGAANRGELVKL
ncbi:MAG: response regulator transcription factor [Spirochaetales bacterium]|jgi:DNA-binding NarL/FixJ family response regulator|nr:response regulator transcription factor [Spirochaetales bacterium]